MTPRELAVLSAIEIAVPMLLLGARGLAVSAALALAALLRAAAWRRIEGRIPSALVSPLIGSIAALATGDVSLALLAAGVGVAATPLLAPNPSRDESATPNPSRRDESATPNPDPREMPVHVEAAWRALACSAPALSVALVALSLSRAPLVALALLPPLALALAEGRRVALVRGELDAVARRVESLDAPYTLGKTIPLRTPAARAAWQDAERVASAASAALRGDADAQRAIEREGHIRARFMAAMGHELRSPLNSIVGFAQVLEDGGDGPLRPGQRENVVIVRRSAQELLRLLTDILDSARLDAGRLRLRRAWFPSVEILTEAELLGRSVVEGQNVAIDIQLQPGLPAVYVDRARIVQAVLAIFRHAAKRKTTGSIAIRGRVGRAPDGQTSLLVQVRDESRTLAPEELVRVFDSFGDLREATGRRIGGLGLALGLARKLARLHGGDAWAESGEGTRYVVSVPLQPLDNPDPEQRRAPS